MKKHYRCYHVLSSPIYLTAIFFVTDAHAQDDYVYRDGNRSPVFYSKTKALVKFKDSQKATSKKPSEIARRAVKVSGISILRDMAFIYFPEDMTKEELQSSLSDLRNDPNTVLAHPIMVSYTPTLQRTY